MQETLRDVGLIPGSGRSPGGGHDNPLQCSYLENPMDRGAWWATVYRVAKSWTGLKWLSLHAGSILVGLWPHPRATAKVLTKCIWGTPCRSELVECFRNASTCFHLGPCLQSRRTINLWASARRRGTGELAAGSKPWGSLPEQGEMSLEQSLTCCDSHLTFKDISASINIQMLFISTLLRHGSSQRQHELLAYLVFSCS